MRSLAFAMLIALASGAGAALAQTPSRNEKTAKSPLEERAQDVCGLFRKDPGNYEKVFAPSFLAQVPTAQLTAIFQSIFDQAGKCTGFRITSSKGSDAAQLEFLFAKGTVSASLAIDPAAPHLIIGLFLHPLAPTAGSLDDVVHQLAALPGLTSFLFARLDGDKIKPLAQLNPDKELAIGSTFKLYVLSELLRTVNNGQRKLSDVVPLEAAAISFPSGFLREWPPGSPLTLQTLASLMITQSDNTAADQLLRTLGREQVEQMLARTGHSKPELDIPFLSTLELFKLKWEASGKMAGQYLALDRKGRREFLAHEVAAVKRDDVRIEGSSVPTDVDSLEWFASAADLCRVMNYLRRNTETPARGVALRAVLAINPGLNIPHERWLYAGYKGGGEAGVMSMTYLLESVHQEWFCLTMTWNNKTAPVEEQKLTALTARALEVAPIGPTS